MRKDSSAKYLCLFTIVGRLGIVVVGLMVANIHLAAANSGPDWIAEGNQVDAKLGWSASTAGDVNGGGYADIIIGAPHYSNSEYREGKVFVYHGSAAGVSSSPLWTAEGDQEWAEFGYTVGIAGDVNGDGFDDVIIGAKGYDNHGEHAGKVFVYYGSITGLSATPAWTAEGDLTMGCFGRSVSTAGDINGDGFADVIIGSHPWTRQAGRAFVYHGSAAGLSVTPDWIASDNTMAWSGCSVGTVGDVNGDGFSDVIVGTYPCTAMVGSVYVYYGSAQGLGERPDWSVKGDRCWTRFGFSVGTAGDVNGDGFSDVIVGDPSRSRLDVGGVYVYYGSATGLGSEPACIVTGDQDQESFGWTASTVGDINADGFADVIIGAISDENGQEDEGMAFMYYGSATGLCPLPAWTAEGNQVDAHYGASVNTAGDVNGDGYDDMIVGACCYEHGEKNEGMVLVYYGGSDKTLAHIQ